MEKATWDEVKALASDFRRTQAITLNQKLTERNCIDIINYLCNNKQISLYFTTDGKTFLTHQELEKEIYEELEICNGRIEITKLSSVLDLDFHTVENTVNKMANTDSDIQIVMGYIVNSTYIRGVALKINEMIKTKGRITILELTQVFLLPKIFVEKIINNNIGNIIEAHKDGEMLYTNNFIRRHTAMIRGYLTRSSKPVSISILNQKFSISDKLIVRIITDDLIENKRIIGKLDQNKSFFIPDCHLKNQKLYFQRFFEQNNYLDFSTMKEIGIQNSAKYIETEFPDLKILSSCALGEGIIFQLEVAIQECDKNENFFNCYQVVPTIVNSQDLLVLVNNIIEKYDKLLFMGNEFVVSKAFISKCVAYFDDIIKSKAEDAIKRNKKSIVNILTDESFHILDEENLIKKEKISKFKSGGGLQGREIKVKSVKHKYLSDKKATNQKSTYRKSNQESTFSLTFLSEDECLEILMKNLSNEDITEDLLREIFQLIEKKLNFNYKSQCKSILQSSDSTKSKIEFQKLELTLSTMINKTKIFHRGLLEITNEVLRKELIKYNLKTICSDIVNCLFEYIAGENDFSWDSTKVTNELKTKLINHVTSNLSVVMKNLHKSLKEDESFDSFYSAFDAICENLNVLPKKLDKKNEKNLISELGAHYHSIIVSKCDENEYIEPSELLVITTVLIFQKIIGLPLHASGKFVPAILEFLKQKSESNNNAIDWDSLKEYQDYVIASIKMQNETVEEKESFKQSHQDLHQKIINIALNWKSIKCQ